MKTSTKKIIGVLFLFVILFFSYNLITKGTLFSLIGPQDSDLLLTSGSSIYMTQASGQPLGGNQVVLMNFNVGMGNDVANVGTTDNESISASGEGKTISYKVYGKKDASDVSVKLGGTLVSLPDIQIAYKGTDSGYSAGLLVDASEAQTIIMNDAIVKGYNSCKATLGSKFVAYSWRPLTSADVTSPIVYKDNSICTGGYIPVANSCANGWIPQVYSICYGTGTSNISYKTFSNKTINSQITIQAESTLNGVTDNTILTTANPSANITDGGQIIGFAKITGFTTSTELPFDLQSEVPVYQNGLWNWVGDSLDGSLAKNNLATLRTMESNYDDSFTGNSSSVSLAIGQYNTARTNFINSLSGTISNYYFTYDSGTDSYKVNYSYTPQLQVILLGNWLGLTREVANFSLNCGSAVSGIEGSTVNSTVVVKNTSTSTSGSGTLAWNCPATGIGSKAISLAGSKSQTISIPFTYGVGTGSCQFTFNGGANPTTPCNINYNFQPKPLNCGNGIIDNGEDCDGSNLNLKTCVSQGFSSGNLACNSLCKFETASCVMDKCGNNIIDAGETCTTCKADLEKVNGAGSCNGIDWMFILLVGGIILVVSGVAYMLFGKKGRR